jgi:hypothetical protein
MCPTCHPLSLILSLCSWAPPSRPTHPSAPPLSPFSLPLPTPCATRRRRFRAAAARPHTVDCQPPHTASSSAWRNRARGPPSAAPHATPDQAPLPLSVDRPRLEPRPAIPFFPAEIGLSAPRIISSMPPPPLHFFDDHRALHVHTTPAPSRPQAESEPLHPSITSTLLTALPPVQVSHLANSHRRHRDSKASQPLELSPLSAPESAAAAESSIRALASPTVHLGRAPTASPTGEPPSGLCHLHARRPPPKPASPAIHVRPPPPPPLCHESRPPLFSTWAASPARDGPVVVRFGRQARPTMLGLGRIRPGGR